MTYRTWSCSKFYCIILDSAHEIDFVSCNPSIINQINDMRVLVHRMFLFGNYMCLLETQIFRIAGDMFLSGNGMFLLGMTCFGLEVICFYSEMKRCLSGDDMVCPEITCFCLGKFALVRDDVFLFGTNSRKRHVCVWTSHVSTGG